MSNQRQVSDLKKERITTNDRAFDSAHASTLVRLPDGSILAAWFGGSAEKAPDVAIWSSRRKDGVWEIPRKTADVKDVAMWNPVLFQNPDGTIVLYYKVGKEIREWVTWYTLSRDGGESWEEPKELVPGDVSGGRGPVKNKPIRLQYGSHKGRILAPASIEGESWDAFVDISDDGGLTWEKSGEVPLRRSGFKDVHRPYEKHRIYGKGVIQPTLWEDETGAVHMLLRTMSSRIFRSDSTDGGRTWCCAYDTGLPNNNSGIDLARMEDGTLLLVYNPRENLPTYYKGPRTPLDVAMSTDNGSTFETLLTLEDQAGNFSYPAIITDGDEVMITYTWNRETIAYCGFRLP